MATISSYLKLNGVAVAAPAPDGFKVSYMDLDSTEGTGRADDGSAFRDYIASKVQLDISWNALKTAEISKILKAVKGGGFFPVTYPDPEAGAIVTKTFYVSDRTAANYRLEPGTTSMTGGLWTGLQFTLVEK